MSITNDLKIKRLTGYLLQTELNLSTRGENPELMLKRFPTLSKILGGLPKGQVTLIGARPSNGKTAFAINLAYELACQNKRVFFLSLEMTIPRLVERLFCMEQRIHNYDLKEGAYSTNVIVRTKWGEFKQTISRLPFVASDMIGKDWKEIDDYLIRLNPKPDAVFIDHIQEISGLGGDRKKAMDEYLRQIRIMCIRDNFALILGTQVNRMMGTQDENRVPQLHQLKGTGFLEESADNVILLHWPWHYDRKKRKDYFEVNVAKNRDGEVCYVKMRFEPQYYRFNEDENPQS